MAAESYENYLRLLKLPRTSTEDDIRTAISKETRIWARRASSGATLDARQEAERKMQTLDAAERVLLGPEGRITRSRLGSAPEVEAQIESDVDAETVARAIRRVASGKGTKAQERKGTVLYRRATIFYRGIDYRLDEIVHKKYEAALDRMHCSATQGGLELFTWVCEMNANSGQGKTGTYIQGPWVVDLIAFASECEDAATG